MSAHQAWRQIPIYSESIGMLLYKGTAGLGLGQGLAGLRLVSLLH